MKATTKLKLERVAAYIKSGESVSAACRKAGTSYSQWYANKGSIGTTVETSDTAGEISVEAPLEEQVIASNLSSKAKVKILTTLLNG